MKSRAIHELRIEPSLTPESGDSAMPQHRAAQPPASCAAPARLTIDALAHYLTRPIQRLVPLVFAVTVLSALYVGWSNRDEGHLTPETGIGYWLGIVGATMMLLLLLYPLRKRVRLLRHLGRVPRWFRLHMLLGVLGPTLILFHSNFKLGSLNSNVALVAMLIVVASGIVGRYLYAKVHKGLYGSRSDVDEIIGDAQALKEALGEDLAGADSILEVLRDVREQGSGAATGRDVEPGQRFCCPASERVDARRAVLQPGRRHHLSAGQTPPVEQARTAQALERVVKNELALYFAAVGKAARFAVYERLLALWHVLHLPLFLLLVITAILHVVAVHLY